MCWVLLIMLLACVLVGLLAQSWKKRTGALWGLLTFLVEVLAFLLLYVILPPRPLLLRGLEPGLRRFRVLGAGGMRGILAALGVGLAMSLVVATLPTAYQERQSRGNEGP